jgi:FkbM family methyltransferase
LDRIAARIAPIVRDQLAARAEAELRRQFDERLLAAVREQVDAIVARELPQQLQALSAQGTQPDGVTAADVVACIEMLLGRTPERELVAYHLGLGFRDRIALGEHVIGTAEFQTRYAARWGAAAASGRPGPIFLGDRVLAFTHRGRIIYLAPTDVDLTPAILLHGIYEPHVEAALVGALRPGDTAIDVGANVGYHTLAIADAVGPEGHVHAFEANPEIMRFLRATMFVNGLSTWTGTGRVCLYHNAALDKPGAIMLASAPGHYGSGHVITDKPSSDYGPAYSTRVEIPAVALDAALADRVGAVDLIHKDIEGSEPLALRGARAIIDRSPRIRIITEWSPAMMAARADVGEFVAWLGERRFRFWRIGDSGSLSEIDRSAVAMLPHCDLLLSRDDPARPE